MQWDSLHKPFFFIIGFISLALGLLGVFLPILPTTPFVLLSAWLFSKSSTRWYNWLLKHPLVGPSIHDWKIYGVIRKKNKGVASVALLLSLGYTLFNNSLPATAKIGVSIIIICVLIFIYSRPSRPIS